MQSALRIVESRCAITTVVRPIISRSSACWISSSVSVSTEEVASSRIRTGAFLSTDGGSGWTALDFGANANEHPFYVAVHPYDCELVLLTTSEGRVVYSSDGGGTWTDLDLGVELGIRDVKLVRLNDDYEAVLLIFGVGGIVAVQLNTAVSYD